MLPRLLVTIEVVGGGEAYVLCSALCKVAFVRLSVPGHVLAGMGSAQFIGPGSQHLTLRQMHSWA